MASQNGMRMCGHTGVSPQTVCWRAGRHGGRKRLVGIETERAGEAPRYSQRNVLRELLLVVLAVNARPSLRNNSLRNNSDAGCGGTAPTCERNQDILGLLGLVSTRTRLRFRLTQTCGQQTAILDTHLE